PCSSMLIDVDHPPLSAHATKVSDIPVTLQEEENWTSLMFTRTFQTPDSPNSVLDYYQKIMPGEGWEPPIAIPLYTPATPRPNWLEPEVANMPGIVGVL